MIVRSIQGNRVQSKVAKYSDEGLTWTPFRPYVFEPRREKIGFLHMRIQRRRSASRSP